VLRLLRTSCDIDGAYTVENYKVGHMADCIRII
jgi:hypothetical protein